MINEIMSENEQIDYISALDQAYGTVFSQEDSELDATDSAARDVDRAQTRGELARSGETETPLTGYVESHPRSRSSSGQARATDNFGTKPLQYGKNLPPALRHPVLSTNEQLPGGSGVDQQNRLPSSEKLALRAQEADNLARGTLGRDTGINSAGGQLYSQSSKLKEEAQANAKGLASALGSSDGAKPPRGRHSTSAASAGNPFAPRERWERTASLKLRNPSTFAQQPSSNAATIPIAGSGPSEPKTTRAQRGSNPFSFPAQIPQSKEPFSSSQPSESARRKLSGEVGDALARSITKGTRGLNTECVPSGSSSSTDDVTQRSEIVLAGKDGAGPLNGSRGLSGDSAQPEARGDEEPPWNQLLDFVAAGLKLPPVSRTPPTRDGEVPVLGHWEKQLGDDAGSEYGEWQGPYPDTAQSDVARVAASGQYFSGPARTLDSVGLDGEMREGGRRGDNPFRVKRFDGRHVENQSGRKSTGGALLGGKALDGTRVDKKPRGEVLSGQNFGGKVKRGDLTPNISASPSMDGFSAEKGSVGMNASSSGQPPKVEDSCKDVPPVPLFLMSRKQVAKVVGGTKVGGSKASLRAEDDQRNGASVEHAGITPTGEDPPAEDGGSIFDLLKQHVGFDIFETPASDDVIPNSCAKGSTIDVRKMLTQSEVTQSKEGDDVSQSGRESQSSNGDDSPTAAGSDITCHDSSEERYLQEDQGYGTKVSEPLSESCGTHFSGHVARAVQAEAEMLSTLQRKAEGVASSLWATDHVSTSVVSQGSLPPKPLSASHHTCQPSPTHTQSGGLASQRAPESGCGEGASARCQGEAAMQQETKADRNLATQQLAPSKEQLRARSSALLSIITAGDRVEEVISVHSSVVDDGMLQLLQRRIATASELASEQAAVPGLRLLLARLEREVAQKQAKPTEKLLGRVLSVLCDPSGDQNTARQTATGMLLDAFLGTSVQNVGEGVVQVDRGDFLERVKRVLGDGGRRQRVMQQQLAQLSWELEGSGKGAQEKVRQLEVKVEQHRMYLKSCMQVHELVVAME